ncbi:MAG TPA: hypothetical protein VMF86_04990, partial [Stellaceae bacterium]|nr:hypothetical protein [Stellaceae bacterium]
AKANLPLPAHDGATGRPSLADAAAADRAPAAHRTSDGRLPVVHPEITAWHRAAADRRIAAAPLTAAGWRSLARRIGAPLLFVALIAAAPSMTYEMLRVTHGTASGHPRARDADKPPVATPSAQIAAPVIRGAHDAVPAVAVAERKPPAPPIMAMAVQPIAVATLDAVAAKPPDIAPAIAPANPPVHPAVARDGVPPVTMKRAAAAPRLSASETTALVARGDALFAAGDVTNARLFYRRGADGGSGPAALRLGESFDPAFLAQAGLGQIRGDAKLAAYWYRRAHDLGVRDAALLLQSLKSAEQK